MRESRIILIDGMPGTGKSTLSQFISRQLRTDGQAVDWCHEESGAHPVRLFYEPQHHRSWSAYSDEVELRWQRFVRQIGSQKKVVVIDAALFQNHIRSMLIFDCDRDVILDLVRRLEKVIAPLDPLLIYLKPRDIEANFRNVVESRGQRLLTLWTDSHDQYPYSRSVGSQGYSGFIKYWKEFDEITDRAFVRIGFGKLRLHVSRDDWKSRYAEVLNFLNVPQTKEVPATDCLARYTGEYQLLDDRSATTFQLRQQGNVLEATVDQPTFEIPSGPFGCFRQSRLIPQARNHFYVAAWPHEVVFEEDATGLITKLHINNTAPGWPPSELVYYKSQEGV